MSQSAVLLVAAAVLVIGGGCVLLSSPGSRRVRSQPQPVWLLPVLFLVVLGGVAVWKRGGRQAPVASAIQPAGNSWSDRVASLVESPREKEERLAEQLRQEESKRRQQAEEEAARLARQRQLEDDQRRAREEEAAEERRSAAARDRSDRIARQRLDYGRIVQEQIDARTEAWKGDDPKAALQASTQAKRRITDAWNAIEESPDDLRANHQKILQQLAYDIAAADVWWERNKLIGIWNGCKRNYNTPQEAWRDCQALFAATQHYGGRLGEIPDAWEWGNKKFFVDLHQNALQDCQDWGNRIQAWDQEVRRQQAGQAVGQAIGGALLKKWLK